MARNDRLTTRAEREALRTIRRLCYSGVDSVTLRQEVARHAQAIVPAEVCGLVATDPDTGLFTHGWTDGMTGPFVQQYMAEFYPEEAPRFLDLARSGRITLTGASEPYQELLRANGLEHRAHAILCSGGEMWGSWCLFREPGPRRFDEKELRFLEAVAPHVGHGMRSAAVIEAADAAGTSGNASAPGVVVLDGRNRITLRSGPVTAHLEDLVNVGIPADPGGSYAVASVLTRLGTARAGSSGPLHVELRAQGRSGRWYALRGSLAEPDASGESARVIVIEPVGPRQAGIDLADVYGLSPREREVLLLVVRGESTKRIALLLGLSAYTVQDHLDRACDKVGVRGRKALLAKLFHDNFASAPPTRATALRAGSAREPEVPGPPRR